MKIKLISIGHKVPKWVDLGVKEYQKRLNQMFELEVINLSPVKRNTSVSQVKALEAEKIQKAAKGCQYFIALDVLGKSLDTPEMATKFKNISKDYKHVAIIIGGPEGIDQDLLNSANETWSLSALTFPHHLVKVLVAEQVYRCWSILNNHPYHRE